jgi:hypothetical protein
MIYSPLFKFLITAAIAVLVPQQVNAGENITVEQAKDLILSLCIASGSTTFEIRKQGDSVQVKRSNGSIIF